jgi:hypothetical protein
MEQWALPMVCMLVRECGLLSNRLSYVEVLLLFARALRGRNNALGGTDLTLGPSSLSSTVEPTDEYAIDDHAFLSFEQWQDLMVFIAHRRSPHERPAVALQHMMHTYVIPAIEPGSGKYANADPWAKSSVSGLDNGDGSHGGLLLSELLVPSCFSVLAPQVLVLQHVFVRFASVYSAQHHISTGATSALGSIGNGDLSFGGVDGGASILSLNASSIGTDAPGMAGINASFARGGARGGAGVRTVVAEGHAMSLRAFLRFASSFRLGPSPSAPHGLLR